jgi:c-di-GMP-related signal transduction protein
MAGTSPSGVEEEARDGAQRHANSADAAPHGLRYVARQAIMDARGNVHGPAASGFSGDGDAATRTVLDNTVIFGLEKLAGGLPVFINCTQEVLLDRLVMVLPPQQTVLEILETLTPTAALLEVCREMKAHGFRLALDDFEWKPAWRPFVELADYIKVDLSTTTQQQRAQIFANLRGSDARLVAERVETQADLKQAKREGFNLFQGYYFCRPAVMENRVVPANNLMHVEMLQALQDEPLDTQRVSNLAKRDASLTYRLLRMEQILLGLRS